jgi:DNA-binding response OmpR family regulator
VLDISRLVVIAWHPFRMPDEHSVVIIEDDTDVMVLLHHVLGMAGFRVYEATSGRDGLQLIRDHRPELVTLDLGLADIDGNQVCRRIRQFSDAYIVVVSGRDDEVDRLVALEIGADDYIVKPFSPRELQARVAALLRRPRRLARPAGIGARESDAGAGSAGSGLRTAAALDTSPSYTDNPGVLRHGSLTLDVEGRVSHIDGVELALTRIEFDLLATLLSGPNRVWSRDALLHQVWGSEWSSDLHLVEVHMGNLRRKLGDDARTGRWIRTVRGVGYRLAPIDSAIHGEPMTRTDAAMHVTEHR